MKLALYRKYRPQKFDDLIGQDHVRDVLRNAIRKERLGHAYLFTGPRGTGKTSSARILARALNCLDLKDGNPCNACEMCSEGLSGSLTDLVEIDAASHGSVEEARDLVERAAFAPTLARKKIYIIDEVHMLSKAAFNALLKLIEEPPDHVHFILATTESHKVLDTIKSRCQRFEFHLLRLEEIVSVLTMVCELEKFSYDKDALLLLAQNGRGSIRDSLSLLEQVVLDDGVTYANVVDILGLAEYEVIRSFLADLEQGRTSEAIARISLLYQEGSDLFQFTVSVLEFLRAELLHEVDVGRHAVRLSKLLVMVDVFMECLDQQRDPIIAQLPLETAIVRLSVLGSDVAPVASEELAAEPIVSVKEDKPRALKPVVATVPSVSLSATTLMEALETPTLRQLIKRSRVEQKGEDVFVFVDSDFSKEKLRHADSIGALCSALESMNVSFGGVVIELDEAPSLKGVDVADVFG